MKEERFREEEEESVPLMHGYNLDGDTNSSCCWSLICLQWYSVAAALVTLLKMKILFLFKTSLQARVLWSAWSSGTLAESEKRLRALQFALSEYFRGIVMFNSFLAETPRMTFFLESWGLPERHFFQASRKSPCLFFRGSFGMAFVLMFFAPTGRPNACFFWGQRHPGDFSHNFSPRVRAATHTPVIYQRASQDRPLLSPLPQDGKPVTYTEARLMGAFVLERPDYVQCSAYNFEEVVHVHVR